jgi:hypothetical protein
VPGHAGRPTNPETEEDDMRLPDYIAREQLFDALDRIGIDADARHHISRINIDPSHVIVTTFATNDEGRHHLGPDGELAKNHTVIPLT